MAAAPLPLDAAPVSVAGPIGARRHAGADFLSRRAGAALEGRFCFAGRIVSPLNRLGCSRGTQGVAGKGLFDLLLFENVF